MVLHNQKGKILHVMFLQISTHFPWRESLPRKVTVKFGPLSTMDSISSSAEAWSVWRIFMRNSYGESGREGIMRRNPFYSVSHFWNTSPLKNHLQTILLQLITVKMGKQPSFLWKKRWISDSSIFRQLIRRVAWYKPWWVIRLNESDARNYCREWKLNKLLTMWHLVDGDWESFNIFYSRQLHWVKFYWHVKCVLWEKFTKLRISQSFKNFVTIRFRFLRIP